MFNQREHSNISSLKSVSQLTEHPLPGLLCIWPSGGTERESSQRAGANTLKKGLTGRGHSRWDSYQQQKQRRECTPFPGQCTQSSGSLEDKETACKTEEILWTLILETCITKQMNLHCPRNAELEPQGLYLSPPSSFKAKSALQAFTTFQNLLFCLKDFLF